MAEDREPLNPSEEDIVNRTDEGDDEFEDVDEMDEDADEDADEDDLEG